MYLTTFGQDMNVMVVVYVLFIVYGAYSLVSAVKMRRDGQISQWLVSANELPRVHDPKGFCETMAPVTIFFGSACMGYGIYGLLNTYLIHNRVAYLIVLVAFFACIIVFVTRLRAAKKKYIY